MIITPPKLLAKVAADVFISLTDSKHNECLVGKGSLKPGEAIDLGLVRKVCRARATTTPAKSLLLQGACNAVTDRTWMWEHGIVEDRRCPRGAEDSPDHWLQGCTQAAAVPRSDQVDKRPSWEEFRKAIQFKTRPCCAAGFGDYECCVQGTLVDVNDCWWDNDMPV